MCILGLLHEGMIFLLSNFYPKTVVELDAQGSTPYRPVQLSTNNLGITQED